MLRAVDCVKTTVDEVGGQVNAEFSVQVGRRRGGQIAVAATIRVDGGGGAQEGKDEVGSKVTARRQQCVDAAARAVREADRWRRRRRCGRSYDRRAAGGLRVDREPGPLVKVVVEGAKLSKRRMKLLIPIYQEGTIDNDLLNEGTYNIKTICSGGYFDATVSVKVVGAETTTIVSAATRPAPRKRGDGAGERGVRGGEGVKHKVRSVTIAGNHYSTRTC